MPRKRILGVSEARLGLSALTVLLVALGYIALLKIGGAGESPPVEVRSGGAALSTTPNDGVRDPMQLQVVPAQGADQTDPFIPYTSQRTRTSSSSLDLPVFIQDGADPLSPTPSEPGGLPFIDITPPR